MSALRNLLVDDEPFDFASFAMPNAADGSVSTTHGRAGRLDVGLLQLLGSELADLAGSIAATTSVANAAASANGPAVDFQAIARYLPPQPHLYPVLIGQLAAGKADVSIVNAIQHFHARLHGVCESTRSAIEALNAEAPHFETGRIEAARLRFIADAWQELCSATIEIADVIDGTCGVGDGLLRRSLRHLTQAAAGGFPCIGLDGIIEVPGLVERRRAPRYPVCWAAQATVEGRDSFVVVENLSRTGLGATCSRHLLKGSAIEIELHSTLGVRRLAGRIAWSKGDRFGVLLATSLGDADPLIVAAIDEAADAAADNGAT